VRIEIADGATRGRPLFPSDRVGTRDPERLRYEVCSVYSFHVLIGRSGSTPRLANRRNMFFIVTARDSWLHRRSAYRSPHRQLCAQR
jgi:hypothetical protein